MNQLIEVFRMQELQKKTRAEIIIKLGQSINHEYAMNLTEPIVAELVYLLDPENEIFKNEAYSNHVKKSNIQPLHLNEKLVLNMCASFRHDFGLLPKLIKDDLIRDCKEWLRAYENNR